MTRALSASRPAPVAVDVAVPAARWDDYVRSRPDASVYHLSAWTGVLARAFGHRTRLLAATHGGEVVGVLPLVFFRSRLFGRFAVSLPFVNYGGIIADTADAATALLDAAVAEAQQLGAAFLELRHTERRMPRLAAKTHKVLMSLRLEPTADRQWARLDRKVRNQVRKAERSGVTVSRGGVDLLDSFYAVFARNMRDLGTPVYAKRFFREILAAFPASTRIVCAWMGTQPAAAALVVWHGDRFEVPWASAVRQFNPACANTLLYWEMVRGASDQGFAEFDFGRSTPGDGPYHFKQQWGARPHEVAWEYWLAPGMSLPNLSPTNPRFAKPIAVWRRLPVALTRAIGPWVVRNIP